LVRFKEIAVVVDGAFDFSYGSEVRLYGGDDGGKGAVRKERLDDA
jgi:hypothetical protein